jgi:hypothetical protein
MKFLVLWIGPCAMILGLVIRASAPRTPTAAPPHRHDRKADDAQEKLQLPEEIPHSRTN